ncbi:TPA: cell division protein FtsQ/DivIB [Neisseria lactamica]|uniref:cell division protein FtsQ/DivIB n=1 Tax=Neisseria lactamica TaxID=486 RepID=UPI000E0DF71F|nr:cell division protein FtsQ/DivIB [Neisseria lactamica]
MWDNAEAMERLTRRLLAVMAVLLASSGLVWFYNSNHLPVKKVLLKGDLVYSDRKVLGNLARKYIHGNILRADIDGAQEAYRRYPWIASAKVRRLFPDTVEIVLTERKPVARWGGSALVDGDGNVFKAHLDSPGLPVFRGAEGTSADILRHYGEFSAILAKQGLGIKEISYTARSAWIVVLDNNITVRLGRENDIRRLRIFAEAWQHLLRKNKNRLSYADMRYKDGFSVRYRTDGLPGEESGE